MKDAELHREVQTLLAMHQQADDFLGNLRWKKWRTS